jgi:translation initiation factor 1 (eIF-1/SUI1)
MRRRLFACSDHTHTDLKIKDVAKAMGKAFACGASVSDTATGGKEIVIQGDVIDALANMLVETYNVSNSGNAISGPLSLWLVWALG